MARSSAQRPRLGNRSETSMLDRPHLVNLRDEASSVPGPRAFRSGSFSRPGMGRPCHFARAGFGSKRSTWLGPPYINKKMHEVARAGMCGARGAAGGGSADFSAAEALAVKKPSLA